MPKISREDYLSLELKIQTEIKKVFSQFIDDLENTPAGPDGTLAMQEKSGPGHAKRSIAIDRILNSPSHAGTNRPRNSLESDMAKIFRKKHRRGSD